MIKTIPEDKMYDLKLEIYTEIIMELNKTNFEVYVNNEIKYENGTSAAGCLAYSKNFGFFIGLFNEKNNVVTRINLVAKLFLITSDSGDFIREITELSKSRKLPHTQWDELGQNASSQVLKKIVDETKHIYNLIKAYSIIDNNIREKEIAGSGIYKHHKTYGSGAYHKPSIFGIRKSIQRENHNELNRRLLKRIGQLYL